MFNEKAMKKCICKSYHLFRTGNSSFVNAPPKFLQIGRQALWRRVGDTAISFFLMYSRQSVTEENTYLKQIHSTKCKNFMIK